MLAAGCALILEPIEQRFLFRPRAVDPVYLESIASRDGGIDDVSIQAADGVTLHGWLQHPAARNGARFPLVIVFGGVRREISWLIGRADGSDQWGWLFINYRGYGLSEGEPSGRLLQQDAGLIYDYAASRPDVDPANLVLLGRSLGAYFAVALARIRPVRAVILATPFDSFAALGAERYPWLPVGLLIDGWYDAAAIAPSVTAPALFVLAERDEITPIQHGHALAQAWGGPRRVVTLAGARHYGIERREEFWNSIGEFLREIETAPLLGRGLTTEAGLQP